MPNLNEPQQHHNKFYMLMQFKLSLDQIQTASVPELQNAVNHLSNAILSLRLHLTHYPGEDPQAIQEFNFQILRLTTVRKAINVLLAERALALLCSEKEMYAA
jgi:hypothetical protein